jgi:cell fate regulator YaaT (PSP1 superfamily)
MRKRKVSEERELNSITRLANTWEVEKLAENKKLEYNTLVRARAIAASLNLDMKIGDVEYQADRRKATFFYTSDDRVDFRDLVKDFAREFKVKIEMRQIGIRQESSKIGGIGSCGRELCCSTWHTNFTSVTTDMVKYQNLSVNQSKLTGLCGRLKCCLNYELDVYLEALEDFPKNSDVLELEYSKAYFVKLDIFKGLMYYTIRNDKERNKIYALSKDRVVEIVNLNKQGNKPSELGAVEFVNTETGDNLDFEDVTGQIELRDTSRNKKKSNKRSGKHRSGRPENRGPNSLNQDNKPRLEKPILPGRNNEEQKDNIVKNSPNQDQKDIPSEHKPLNPVGQQSNKNKKKFRRFPNKNKNTNKKDGE